MRFDFHQQAGGVEVGDDGFACIEAVQAAVLCGDVIAIFNDLCGTAEDIDQWQVVPLTHRVVIEIMCRGHLHHAGAKGAIHIVVGDDRDAPAGQRQVHTLAVQREVARVFRVHHRGGIAEHGFRAGGGHHQIVAGFAQGFHAVGIDFHMLVRRAIGQWIAQRPQRAVFLLADHFEVRNRGFQHRIPIDQALAAIDQAFFMQPHEGFDDGLRWHRVHREHTA